jgi:hypothetical protein
MALRMQEEAKRVALRDAEDGALDKQRAAVTRALDDTVPAHELEATRMAAAQAEQRTSQLQAQNDELASQADALTAELARAHSEAAELHDVRETSEAAIAGLHETLAKIDKHVGRGRGGACSTAAAGSHGTVPQEDVQLASLSRQIVHAKLAEADAQRKLRVSARQELEHRQRLAGQAERISSLKEAIVALRAEFAQLKGAARTTGASRSRAASAEADRRGRDTTRPLPPSGPRARRARLRVSFEDEAPAALGGHVVRWQANKVALLVISCAVLMIKLSLVKQRHLESILGTS